MSNVALIRFRTNGRGEIVHTHTMYFSKPLTAYSYRKRSRALDKVFPSNKTKQWRYATVKL